MGRTNDEGWEGIMTKLCLISDRVVRSIRAIREDEEGINTIEMVLIVCAAATLLAVAYKYLWGSGSTGLIAVQIKNVVNKFSGVFTGDYNGGWMRPLKARVASNGSPRARPHQDGPGAILIAKG